MLKIYSAIHRIGVKNFLFEDPVIDKHDSNPIGNGRAKLLYKIGCKRGPSIIFAVIVAKVGIKPQTVKK